jgi:GT2 family glycosyltransferase
MVLAENRGFAGGASALLSEIFQNSGPSISSEASLRWALFLSNDCELEEGALQEPSEAGLYAPTVLRRKTGQVESLGGYIETGRFRLHHCKDAESFNQRCKTNTIYIPGASFWIDQNSWSRLGSFNEGLFAYWEDVELSLRASKLGIPLGLHPSTRLRHGIGKTCHKDPYYTSYLYQRNRIWVARAHLPFTQRIFFGLRLGWEFLRRSAHQIRSGDLSRLSLSSKAFRRGFFSKNPVHL